MTINGDKININNNKAIFNTMLEQSKIKYVKPDIYQKTVVINKVITGSDTFGDGSATGVETIYDL